MRLSTPSRGADQPQPPSALPSASPQSASQRSSQRPSQTRWPVLATALSSLSLTACIAIPVDSRTGQPLPTWPVATGPREITVITPPAPAAPAPQTVYTARLYPVNDAASRNGVLTALVIDGHDGRGRLTLQYRGDHLQGEASRVEAGHPGFGRVHQEVLGGAPRQSSGRRGIANAAGAQGAHVQCEYVITGPAQGTGVCRFSDGAHYQLHFG